MLTPIECERLNGFPDDWTAGMPERLRYFTIWEMRLSFLWSRPWASGSAHWPRTSSAVDGRFSWVSKGVRVATGDLKMQRILKHLTEPTGERQHPFGTRLCLQSLVCYTLVPADAEKGLRAGSGKHLFCGRRMRGWAWQLTVSVHRDGGRVPDGLAAQAAEAHPLRHYSL